MPADSAGLESPDSVALRSDSGPDDSDPSAPVLTPDDDYDASSEEVRLILDPDPELSSGGGPSRPGTPPSRDESAADSAPTPVEWLIRSWPWIAVVVAAIALVLLLILATI